VSGSGPAPDDEPDGALSSFNLSISLSIGYQRKRAKLAGKWEASITSIGLLLGGIAVVLLFMWWLLTRLALL
jgi:hypothetical protein